MGETIHSENSSYNENLHIRESHNCYTYFLNLKSKHAYLVCKKNFHKQNMCYRPQPGYASGHSPIKKDRDYNCKNVMKRTLKDNIHMYKINNFERKCPKDYYKGAVVVAPGRDFHYYRENDNGIWTHKPGYKPSTNLDSNNIPIKNPEKSNRNYGHDSKGELNYKDFCGFVCVPRDRTKKNMKMYSEVNKKSNKNKNRIKNPIKIKTE